MFYYAFDCDVAQVYLLYGSVCLWSVYAIILSVYNIAVRPRLLAEFLRSSSALGLSGQRTFYPTYDRVCSTALTVWSTVCSIPVINIA